MPLYCPANSVFFESLTRLEVRYDIPGRASERDELGYTFLFFIGVGTEEYQYSINNVKIYYSGTYADVTFGGLTGKVITDDGVWSDPSAFVIPFEDVVRVQFEVRGWLPILNYGSRTTYYRLANSDGSVEPEVIMEVAPALDTSCYLKGLPSEPVISGKLSTYVPALVETDFNWPSDSWRVEPSNYDRAIDPNGVVWEIGLPSNPNQNPKWGSGGVIDIVDGKAQLDVSVASSYMNFTAPVYRTSGIFDDQNGYWELEIIFTIPNEIGDYADIELRDGYDGSAVCVLEFRNMTPSNDWNFRFFHYTQVGSTTVLTDYTDDEQATVAMRMRHDLKNKTLSAWYKIIKKGTLEQDFWTHLTGSPYNYVSYNLPPDPAPAIRMSWHDGPPKTTLSYFGARAGEELKTYLVGYLHLDLSSMTGTGKGTAHQTPDMGYAILPGLVVGAYQSNNERADVTVPMLTITATAEWQEASMTFPSWHMGGYEDTYDAYGLMTLPALTLSVDMDYQYSCLIPKITCVGYSFIQGVPENIIDEHKPSVLLFGSESMEDLAETVFWGLS